MELTELFDICINKKKCVCIVGAGGKTTLMYTIAIKAAIAGKKVVVSTTTHIKRPKEYYASDLAEIKALWREGKYAVTGANDLYNTEKIVFSSKKIYDALLKEADLILLESDGAKGFPCKVPMDYEPVITTECDLVIGVMGMSALGKHLKECCFRYETKKEWLGDGLILDEKMAVKILSSEKGTKKGVEKRDYIVVLNQCDSEEALKQAQKISNILFSEYKIKSVCSCLCK